MKVMELETHYIVLPVTNIWVKDAIVDQIRSHHQSKKDAIEVAKNLSRTYDADFYVMKLETLVQTKTVLSHVSK